MANLGILKFPLALLGGALAALAMAPYNCWYVLFVSVPIFYFCLMQALSLRGAFCVGWLYGFGFFVFSLSWIGNALLVEGNAYAWAWPLAVCGLPAFLALFWGVAGLCLFKFFDMQRVSGIFGLVCVMSLIEWLRGHLFTGFPWNLYGYAWADFGLVLQVLKFSDVYGLTFLTWLWACTPSLIWVQKSGRIAYGALALGSFSLVLGFGVYALSWPLVVDDRALVKVVQPNISQAEKWDSDKAIEHFHTLLKLSEYSGDEARPTLILWPESAISFRVLDTAYAREQLRGLLGRYPKGAELVAGALLYDSESGGYTNSIVLINSSGVIAGQYDKHHLVPFGEYIPFQEYIPIRSVTRFEGFKVGPGPSEILSTTGIQFSPLVCYEILFPEESVAVGAHVDAIFNVTNDAWYGESAGPYQHFIKAKFRAVENGISVYRSANTGISGMITSKGESVYPLPLSQSGANVYSLYRPAFHFSLFYKTVFNGLALLIMAFLIYFYSRVV